MFILLLQIDVEREGALGFSLIIDHDESVLSCVVGAAIHDVQAQLGLVRCHLDLHGDLGHLPPVLHPADLLGRSGDFGDEGGGPTAVDRRGLGEAEHLGSGQIFSGHVHDQRAGGEALSDVVEGLAGVGAGVLREDLLDLEEVGVAGVLVDEVLGGLDLLLVVEPDHVEAGVAGHGALKLDGVAVLDQLGACVLVDAGSDGGA